jgi:protein-tyrosine phosphatase
VCTGNRCRSPFAAAYVEAHTEGVPVEVSSVGTLHSPGLPSPPELIELAAAQGLRLDEHLSRTTGALDSFDLIVGFELAHVAYAVVEAGADASKTFILPELARLLSGLAVEPGPEDPVVRARDLVAAADGKRKERGPDYEQVADPFGGPVKAYEEMATAVSTFCDQVTTSLFPRTS